MKPEIKLAEAIDIGLQELGRQKEERAAPLATSPLP